MTKDEQIASLAARLAEADDKLLSVAIELGATKARLAEKDETIDRMQGLLETCDVSMESLRARLAETQAALAELIAEHDRVMAEWKKCVDARYDDFMRAPFAFVAADSASVVQYKPCEICTTQSWCETHGCQCYPVSAVQPERCCLDYPRCDCNSPPEPDNEWHCSQYPGCECFAGCREKALEAAP
jgi:hypothetical protein